VDGELGADSEARNKAGECALHLSSGLHNHEYTSALLERGANVNPRDSLGRRQLVLACVARGEGLWLEVVRTIDVIAGRIRGPGSSGSWCRCRRANQPGPRSRTLFVLSGRVDLSLMLLLLHGADGSARKLTDRSALYLAAERGHLAVVEQLVAGGGVKVDWRDAEGNTGLCEAALHGRNTGVALLIQLGADASIANFATARRWRRSGGEAARLSSEYC
jgi:ankyrin repeat protein